MRIKKNSEKLDMHNFLSLIEAFDVHIIHLIIVFTWVFWVIEIEATFAQINIVISRHCLKHMSILDVQIDTRAYHVSVFSPMLAT